MSLEMRNECEKCHEKVHDGAEVYICSYECTFCPACTEMMEYVCPNCQGELVKRPKRKQL